jgi:hypothetical protein
MGHRRPRLSPPKERHFPVFRCQVMTRTTAEKKKEAQCYPSPIPQNCNWNPFSDTHLVLQAITFPAPSAFPVLIDDSCRRS